MQVYVVYKVQLYIPSYKGIVFETRSKIPMTLSETTNPITPQTISVRASEFFSAFPTLRIDRASPHKNAANDSPMIMMSMF